ncbi:MAG: ATP-binding protein [Planctomycetota bacterium]|nr:ATP-binding protein [Planctomycetota bacterium]
MLSELRRLAPQMPVLVLSTVFNAKSVARAIELGAEDYLHKPVDLKELRRTVNILLELDDAGRPARRAKDDATGHLVVRAESEGTFMEITAPTGSPHIERFQGFVHRLLAASLPKDEYLNVRLALEESVTNAIEWGNRHDRTKNVKLSYCLMLDRVTLRIEDEGEGFTPEKIPDPSVDPVAHLKRRKNEGKRVGGWGLFLTKRAVDEVWYNKKGNVVFLTKFLRKPANAEAEAKLNA